MTYEDIGVNQYFERDISTPQLPIEVIPDFSGANIDRIIESFPVDMILPTGSLKSADGKVEFNLKEGYISFLDDRNNEVIKFGKQNDGTFGFFIRKHTGDQIMDEEGIKDTSIALRTDVEKLASEPERETKISKLPFFTKSLSLVYPEGYITNPDWREEPTTKFNINIAGQSLGIASAMITGWSDGAEFRGTHFFDGIQSAARGVAIQQSQRESVTLVTPFEFTTSGNHTISVGTQAIGWFGNHRFRLELIFHHIVVFGKQISTT